MTEKATDKDTILGALTLGYNRLAMKAYFQGLTNHKAEFYPGGKIGEHISKPDLPEFDDRSRYKHPCWCEPSLMFEDEEDNLQLWLHNRVQ